MNRNIRKVAGKGLKVSRKILCILLTGVLLLQTGCTTTHVLQTVEREEQKTDEHKHLDLKPGQLVRLTYQKGASTKTLIGRIKSATSDVLVVLYEGRQIRISFDGIKKIEIVEEETFDKKKYIVAVVCAIPVFVLLYFLSYPLN